MFCSGIVVAHCSSSQVKAEKPFDEVELTLKLQQVVEILGDDVTELTHEQDELFGFPALVYPRETKSFLLLVICYALWGERKEFYKYFRKLISRFSK